MGMLLHDGVWLIVMSLATLWVAQTTLQDWEKPLKRDRWKRNRLKRQFRSLIRDMTHQTKALYKKMTKLPRRPPRKTKDPFEVFMESIMTEYFSPEDDATPHWNGWWWERIYICTDLLDILAASLRRRWSMAAYLHRRWSTQHHKDCCMMHPMRHQGASGMTPTPTRLQSTTVQPPVSQMRWRILLGSPKQSVLPSLG